MHSRRTCLGTFIVFFLVFMLILPAIVPSVLAETSNASTTTLHFTEYTPFSLDGLGDESGSTQMSTEKPTKTNDSEWPPSLFVKNKLIPSINKDEWLSWFELWAIYKLSLEVGNVSGEEDGFSADMLKSFFELMNPFKVTEEYQYTGTETREMIFGLPGRNLCRSRRRK